MKKQCFGVIVTTRDIFPLHLAVTARQQITDKLGAMGYDCVMLPDEGPRRGAVVSFEEAQTCAELFKAHREEISGILVVLPNFGEETGVAEAIDRAGLNVPVLVQACDDEFHKLGLETRRDAFCGKLSCCNNLYYRNIPFTTTTLHTCTIDSAEYTADLERFAAVCRVVTGLRGARVAAIGTRPNAFNTVRHSERLLQRLGVTVCTAPMADAIAAAEGMADNDPTVAAKIEEIQAYGRVACGIGEEKLVKQAKLCLAMEGIVEALHCDASAIECWDAVENYYGCATCLSMSMMGEAGKPSACEMDVSGAVTMLALRLATGEAPAYMDWNNNVDDNRNQCVNLHCSNFPRSFFQSEVEIENLDVLATTLGADKCFGACKGQVAAGPFTYFKLTTDDFQGKIRAYAGEGRFLERRIESKGGLALCEIEELQGLMRYLCANGYEHHVGMARGHVAEALHEAFTKYLGVEVYQHG